MMRVTHIVAGLLLAVCATGAAACELPPLVVIPARDQVGDQGPQITEAAKTYRDAMQVYAECVKAELQAAGGDSAPAIVKSVLVQRNNAAVAEVQAVMKIYTENVGVQSASQFPQGPPAGPAPEASSEKDKDKGKKR
jgi:hypothetical protein